jgi:hypothetical protein
MKAVGGIDALKKLTKREWLWCLDSVIRETKEEYEFRGAFFMGSTASALSPKTEVESAQGDGDKTKVDRDYEKRLQDLLDNGGKVEEKK